MQLDEFFNYKNQLMNDLMTSEQIVCLLNDSEEVRCDPEQLVYSQVFPYEYVPDTIVHGQTFICCDVDIQRVESKTFLRPTLYIWVFTHKSCVPKSLRKSMAAGTMVWENWSSCPPGGSLL